ncbi:MAG: peptidoglycan editing factor PgeF [Candidatus Electryonea clarkiae]|nr:peptidoglycan editing factor PgeF [Candidatus Electryonea clarkiae]MDP8286717.1 peptidoglycan editing factor PgeF [Candidatus Electryonea clarkiae]
MVAAPFSAHNVNTERAAVEGSFDLPDGSSVTWALSRSEFGPMSFKNHPSWDVAHNRIQYLKLFGLVIEDAVSLDQQHTAKVLTVTSADKRKGAREIYTAPGIADGLVTQDTNLILLTTHADCMPVWLCAPSSGWIGMGHAGWRGLKAGLINNLIEAVPEKDRSDLVVAIGPCISPANYEIGQEVASEFINDKNLAEAVHIDDARYYLDLAKGARLQCEAAGVKVLTDTAICTYKNRYFLSSYRRDGELFSPMAAFIHRTNQ